MTTTSPPNREIKILYRSAPHCSANCLLTFLYNLTVVHAMKISTQLQTAIFTQEREGYLGKPLFGMDSPPRLLTVVD